MHKGINGPISSRDYAYLTAFTLMCVIFVPVYFAFGRNEIIVPLSGILFDALLRFLRTGQSGMLPFGWLVMALYGLGFMAWGCFGLILARRFHGQAGGLFRIMFLLLPCAISLLPLITYASWAGRGGAYNFWTAVIRYLEKWI